MKKCELCNKEFKNIKGLSSHIFWMHKEISKEDYYKKYLMVESSNRGFCLFCGKKCKFVGFDVGYLKYCSTMCSNSSEETKIKSKNTCMMKFGFNYASSSKIFRESVKNTCMKKYGVDNISKNGDIKKKKEITVFSNYGVNNPSQSKQISEFVRNKKLKMYYNRLIKSDRFKNMTIPLVDIGDYKGVKGFEYDFKCIKCNNVFKDNLDSGKIPRCPKCYPFSNTSSKSEKDLFEYIKNICFDAVEGDRKVLNGFELDIYIPSKNLAIEFDGLYWHSELNGKDRKYHLNKTISCEKKGIRLIHIFEDEWVNKEYIVKSIIDNKIDITPNKIFARKCDIRKVDKEESFNFLESNHIQGFIDGSFLGLYFKNKLVYILGYGTPRFNKKYSIEILRSCSELNTVVVGGLSKLVNCISDKSIITYVDRRFGDKKSYDKIGFKLNGVSEPSYYYIKGYKLSRYNRIQFQKHKLKSKLESYDPNLTEWQNMQLSGYDRIWDCGNFIYTKE